MATGKAEIRGYPSGLELLAVPRPATRIGLLAVSACLGYLAWYFLPVGLQAYIFGICGSFSILCAGAIWSIRDKAEALSEGDFLSATEFKKACNAARILRQKATRRAAWVAICALAAVSPAVSQQLGSAIWGWMPVIAGLGVAEAAYGFLVANAWGEEVRQFRNDQQFRAKEQVEREAIIGRIQNEAKSRRVDDDHWTKVAGTLTSVPHR